MAGEMLPPSRLNSFGIGWSRVNAGLRTRKVMGGSPMKRTALTEAKCAPELSASPRARRSALAGVSGGVAEKTEEANEIFQLMVCVEPARIGQHPNGGITEQFTLAAQRRLRLFESASIGGDAEHRQETRSVSFHFREQTPSARDQFVHTQLIGTRRAARNQIRHAAAGIQKFALLPRRELTIREPSAV